MIVTRSVNVFGFTVTTTVEVPQVAQLSASMTARLEHHLEVGLAAVARRVAHYVIDWPKRQQVLQRMPADDANVLGLMREWRQARKETAA